MSSYVAEPRLSKASSKPIARRLFFLDAGGSRVLSSNPDGTELETLVSEGRRLPDGIAVDVPARHIYARRPRQVIK
jgi:hypothetical protein